MKSIYALLVLLMISLSMHAQATGFITGLNNPHDILLDGNILYIAESDAGRIIKADVLETNPVPEVVIAGIPNVYGLALKGTELYFSQLNGQNKISKIDLSVPNPTPTVVLDNFPSVRDLIFYGNDLYIAQSGYDRIVKIDPSIPNPPIIEILTDYESPVALEVVGDIMFIAANGENKVSKFDLTSPNPVAIDVIGGLSLPRGLIHRGNELYIAEAGQSIYQDWISKIDITSSNPIRTIVVDGLFNPTQGLEIHNDVLFIAQDFGISKFGLPPLAIPDYTTEAITIHPNPSADFVTVSGLQRPIDYTIYSLSGVALAMGSVANNEKININTLATGIYFLVLDNTDVKKMVKE